MAILKRWNGTAWVEDYPKTVVGQIVASGTPDSTTFLRGDGAWAVPGGSATSSVIFCATATSAATIDKVITLAGYTLTTGDLLAVSFTNGNSASSMTININSSGAKTVYLNGSTSMSVVGILSSAAVALFYYDGTYFRMVGSQRTTDSDTQNTAGAANSTSKLFLVGTTSQATGTSYSNSAVYATNGALTADTLVSAVAIGTAPLTVTSTTKVTNLNVDLLDGYHTSIASAVSTIPVRDANENIATKSASVTWLDFNTTPGTMTDIAGRVYYNSDEDTLNIVHSNGSVQQVGHEFYMAPLNNNSGAIIPNGAVVMATGATGDQITIAKAITNGTVDPIYMIGVATGTIAIGAEKQKVTTHGLVRGLDTSLWTIGTVLYPNPSVAGGFTSTKPTAPNIKTPIAMVLKQSASSGIIYVRMTNGSKLGDTDSNVEFSTLTNKQMIAYNGSTSRWENTPTLGWDFTNSRLGVGTLTPTEKLSVAGNIGVESGNYLTDGGSTIGFNAAGGINLSSQDLISLFGSGIELDANGNDVNIYGTGLFVNGVEVSTATHTHGNITSDGKIGTTADLIVKTTTGGALTALAAGTAGQFLSYNGTWAIPTITPTINPSDTTLYPIMVGDVTNTAQTPYADAGLSFDSTNDLLSIGTGSLSWELNGSSTSSFYIADSTGVPKFTLSNSGVITNATWNGVAIPYNYGGTTLTSFGAAGRILYSTSSSALATLAAGTAGQYLKSNGTSAPSWNFPGVGLTSAFTVSATANSYSTALDSGSLAAGVYMIQLDGAYAKSNTTSASLTLSARIGTAGYATLIGSGYYGVADNTTTFTNFYLNNSSATDGAAGTGFTTSAIAATRTASRIQFSGFLKVTTATNLLIRVASGTASAGYTIVDGSSILITRIT